MKAKICREIAGLGEGYRISLPAQNAKYVIGQF
jgi:hypothetical protein